MTYSAKDIKVFKNLEAVRNRPTTYIGPVDSAGKYTILKETLDNALDEYQAKRNDSVSLVYDGKYFWIADNGGGIPVEKHPTEKVSTLEVAVGYINAGAKFSDDVYKNARGTHGIGVASTNAMSEHFQVWTQRNKIWYTIEYEQGKKLYDVEKSKAPKIPELGTWKKGTVIKFCPDETLFDSGSSMDWKAVISWAELSSILNPGFHVTVINKGKVKEFYSKEGISKYLENLYTKNEASKIGASFIMKDETVDVALVFTDYDGTLLQAYTNGLRNIEGGKHVDSLFKAIEKVLNKYKTDSHKFTSVDLREGVVGLVNMKMSTPQFSNQPKDKLVDSRVSSLVDSLFVEKLTEFFENNKTMAKTLCQRADKMKDLRDSFKEHKKALEVTSKAVKSNNLPSKLLKSDAPVELREIFIVEGDSALGSAKMARDARFQEILPLRGKITNVMKKSEAASLVSATITDIMVSLHLDPSLENAENKLRVGKIIIMTDADSDGLHIATLLNTLFAVFSIKLFKQGRVFIAQVPEYMAVHKGKRFYGDSIKAVRKQVGVDNINIQHLKGLGEMDYEALAETAFNPLTRKLIKINPVNKAEFNEFCQLMAQDVSYRKKLLGL